MTRFSRRQRALSHSNTRCSSILPVLVIVAARDVISLSALTNGAGDRRVVVQAYHAKPPPSFSHFPSVPHHSFDGGTIWSSSSRDGINSDGKKRYPRGARTYTSLSVIGESLRFRGGGGGGGAETNGLVVSSTGRRVATSLVATTSPASSSDAEDVERRYFDKYHLIWSPNFWKKFLMSTAIWFFVQYAFANLGGRTSSVSHDLPACHGLPDSTPTMGLPRLLSSSIGLPLLSSSCCALQLMMNALTGWGCAGFNSYLGPIRPVSLSLLLILTWTMIPYQSRGWTIVSLSLAFLPELVDIWNANRSKQWRQLRVDDKRGSGEKSSITVEAKLTLNIPTMGCVACVNKVDASIRRCNSAASIKEETSWLTGDAAKGGGAAELTIVGGTNEEIDRIVEEVVASVKDAGFRCDVESLRVHGKR